MTTRGNLQLPVVLAEFRSTHVGPRITQRSLLDYQSWLMSVAYAARRGGTPESDHGLAAIRESMDRYGVSPEFVRHRQICAIPPGDCVGEDVVPGRLSGILSALREQAEGPSLEARTREFVRVVDRFLEDYCRSGSAPADVVHVTRCGYVAPSPVQRMVSARGWHSTGVTNAYHMGCLGGFPAVRTAIGLLAASRVSLCGATDRVDVIHTEPLSLHFDAVVTASNLVVTTIFGDGFISYSAYPEHEARSRGLHGLRVLAYCQRIIPDSADEVTETSGAHRIDVRLSKRVPALVRTSIRDFVRELCARAELEFEECRPRLCFAIHPGGPKVVRYLAEALEIESSQIALSAQVLREHGNMASATVPHIWQRIVDDDAIVPGTRVLTVGFGPGLTVAGMLLERV